MADGGLRVTGGIELAGLADRARRAGRAASLAAAQDILARAVGIAPRRTGAMAASGFARLEGDGAVVGFGAAYAPYQHDKTWLRHPGGGRARFLAEAAEHPGALAAMEAAFWREMG